MSQVHAQRVSDLSAHWPTFSSHLQKATGAPQFNVQVAAALLEGLVKRSGEQAKNGVAPGALMENLTRGLLVAGKFLNHENSLVKTASIEATSRLFQAFKKDETGKRHVLRNLAFVAVAAKVAHWMHQNHQQRSGI